MPWWAREAALPTTGRRGGRRRRRAPAQACCSAGGEPLIGLPITRRPHPGGWRGAQAAAEPGVQGPWVYSSAGARQRSGGAGSECDEMTSTANAEGPETVGSGSTRGPAPLAPMLRRLNCPGKARIALCRGGGLSSQDGERAERSGRGRAAWQQEQCPAGGARPLWRPGVQLAARTARRGQHPGAQAAGMQAALELGAVAARPQGGSDM